MTAERKDEAEKAKTGGWRGWFQRTSGPALPASIEEAAKHSQLPQPSQGVSLGTDRVVSSIPRGGKDISSCPAHQPKTSSCPAHQPQTQAGSPEQENWVYPSEQQFYNAMVRKGYGSSVLNPHVEVPHIIRIHNAVNEQTFDEIRKWERLSITRNNYTPRLVRFLGRGGKSASSGTTDENGKGDEGSPDYALSPKAWININLLGKKPPFDRHDWYVDDGGGTTDGTDSSSPLPQRRYVIDFYEGNPQSGPLAVSQPSVDASGTKAAPAAPISMHLDVRPALDDPTAFVDRAYMAVRDLLPGIFTALDQPQQSPPGRSVQQQPPREE